MKQIQGQSLVEVVIAIALISVILISLVGLASLSIRASAFSRNQTEAQRYTQQSAEWLRSEKDASWTTFKANAAAGTYCLNTGNNWGSGGSCASGSTISGTIFTRSVKFTNNADGTIEADVSTSWLDAQGTHIEPTSIIFADFK